MRWERSGKKSEKVAGILTQQEISHFEYFWQHFQYLVRKYLLEILASCRNICHCEFKSVTIFDWMIFMLQRTERKEIHSCESDIGAEGPSFHRRFAREKIEVLLECWGESIKEIYLIASWNAQFSIHFLDGRGWMVVQITLLHLQEVICLSETAKIILL